MLLYSFFTMIVVLINSENTNLSNKGMSKIMSPVEVILADKDSFINTHEIWNYWILKYMVW